LTRQYICQVRSRLVGLAVTTVSLYGCGSSTAPHSGGNVGPISFIGANQSDTIQTALPQALIVTVTGPRGQSSHGHVVQFVSVLDSSGSSYEAYVAPLTSQQFSTFLADTLDALGRASADIVLGSKAGTAMVLVKVPDFGYVDTARFTVKPGNTASILVTPGDTTVIEGAAITLHASTVDRFSNPTSQGVQLAVTGPATISNQTLTTTGVGRITVVTTSGGLAADTTYVSSVPSGILAASTGNGIALFNFDGTGMKQLALNRTVGNLKWAPSGKSLAFDQNSIGCTGNSNVLLTTDLQGNVTVVNSGSAGDMYPSYSRDGTWIYFTSNNGSQAALWRVHPDGTSADSLTNLNPSLDLYPSPSPDGTQVVYSTILSGYATADLRVLTVSTGAVTDLNINGWAPSWSPAGNLIVYLQGYACQSTLAIANADGTGARVLSSDAYQGEFDWSPDGQWIVAYNVSRNRIDLINATSGVTLPLTFTSGLSSPSWQPAQPVMARVRQLRRGHFHSAP